MKDYSKENLDVTHYRNGDPIPFVKSKKQWSNLTTGAYCYYDDNPEKGVLYNWYAVNDSRGLAPEGWKIPTIEELEQIDLTTGLPSGFRFTDGSYNLIGCTGYWWSLTENSANNAWLRYSEYRNGSTEKVANYKKFGFSVRCLKDEVIINKRNKMKTGILKFHSEGSQYVIIIRNKKYSKLLAIQDYPQRKYYFKNEEVSEEKLVTELDNIGSSERMYSEEDMAEAFIACWKANVSDGIECKVSFNEWFKQFKKK